MDPRLSYVSLPFLNRTPFFTVGDLTNVLYISLTGVGDMISLKPTLKYHGRDISLG